ncbi:family 43 glycosylhydrolase [Carboxylicivirga sp. RSCT41]|uniref:family 43 glycosylhydrolase n=1 Tax=Carboxylicivirga agarovorans TaxID=3417570 RepID=UPI003D334416
MPRFKIPIYILFITGLIATSCSTKTAETTNALHPVYCNPINLNYNVQYAKRPRPEWKDKGIMVREGADPTIVLFKDKYYLFSSVSDCYWSSDNLTEWGPITPTDTVNLPIIFNYAPTVVVINDKMYLKDGNGDGCVYSTESPDDPNSWKPMQNKGWLRPDSQFFLDDDGRLWNVYGCSPTGYLHIQEMDIETFTVIGKTYSFYMPDVNNRGWERGNRDSRGNNENESHGWVEGGQLFKHNGKYYFVYSLPDLSNAYANGVYVADDILGPYTYQQHNPVTQKLTGFASGAAHGQIFKDKYDNWWTLTCQSVWAYDRFERRIGLFPTFIDDDGTLHTDTYLGDYPTFVPQHTLNDKEHLWAGMNLISHNKSLTASSVLKGHEPLFCVDEKIDTWWSAKTSDKGEWIKIDLFEPHVIQGIQVNFAEQDLTMLIEEGACMKYFIEGSNDNKKWEMLLDKSENTKDVPHDFSSINNDKSFRYVKITNIYTPYGGKFALRGLRIFGHGLEKSPAISPRFTVKRNNNDPRQASVNWEEVADADGYIIRYGINKNKLYNNNVVYRVNSYDIRSLDRETDYYITIESFNENGVTRGKEIKFIPSNTKGLGVKMIEAESIKP